MTIAISLKSGIYSARSHYNKFRILGYEEISDNKTDTSTWQTYRNEEFGFEVKYPENWKIVDQLNIAPLHQLVVFSSKGHVSSEDYELYGEAGVQISPIEKITLRRFIEEENKRVSKIEQGVSITQPIPITFAGSSAAEQTESREMSVVWIITLPEQGLKISVGGNPSEKGKEIINQILSTFRFVE